MLRPSPTDNELFYNVDLFGNKTSVEYQLVQDFNVAISDLNALYFRSFETIRKERTTDDY